MRFTDVVGVLAEQWAQKQEANQADWLLGEGCLGPKYDGVAFRSMRAPGTAFEGDAQPVHMDNYRGMLEGPHINSGGSLWMPGS